MHVLKPTYPEPRQTLGFRLKIPKSRRPLWRNDQYSVVIPGGRQATVGINHPRLLQTGPYFPLTCLKVTQGVLRVDRINLDTKTILHLEYRLGTNA